MARRRKADPTRIAEADYEKVILQIKALADQLAPVKHYPVMTQIGVRTCTMLKEIVRLNKKKDSEKFIVIRPSKATIKTEAPKKQDTIKVSSPNQAASTGGNKSKKTRNSKTIEA